MIIFCAACIDSLSVWKAHLTCELFPHNQRKQFVMKCLSPLICLLLTAGCFSLALMHPVMAQPPEINLVELLYSSGYDGRTNDHQGVFTWRHIKPWSIGDNFLFIDVSDVGNFGSAGSTYIEWGPRLSLGKTLSKAPWKFGLIRDVFLVGEINHAHNKRVINTTTLEGISVDLSMPGFQVFKVHLENRNDPDQPGHTGQMSIIFNYPFRLGAQQFSVEGFLDVVGREGRSAPNVHTQPQLVWKWRENINIGLEYQYWHNKTGREGFTESGMQGMVRINF